MHVILCFQQIHNFSLKVLQILFVLRLRKYCVRANHRNILKDIHLYDKLTDITAIITTGDCYHDVSLFSSKSKSIILIHYLNAK